MTILGHSDPWTIEHNTTVGIAEWHDRNGSKTTKKAKTRLKKEKPTIK